MVGLDAARERTALEIGRDGAAMVFFLVLSVCLVKAWLALDPVLYNLDRTVVITGRAMANVELASRGMTAREDAELKLVNGMATQVSGVVASANQSVDKLNSALDNLNTLVADSNRNMNTLSSDADAAIKTLPATTAILQSDLAAIKPVLDDAHRVLGDPNIQAVLLDLAGTSHKASLAMGNLEDVSADGKQVADHYRDLILAPVNKTHAALSYAGKWSATVLGNALHF